MNESKVFTVHKPTRTDTTDIKTYRIDTVITEQNKVVKEALSFVLLTKQYICNSVHNNSFLLV